METCPICGKNSYRKWTEIVDDTPYRTEVFEECVNPNCGEESSSEDE